MTRPLSLAAITALELTPPEMVTCAAAAGFRHVGMWLLAATTTEPRYDLIDADAGARRWRSRARTACLGGHEAGAGASVCVNGPALDCPS